jgi:hypothetical protein
MQPIMRMNKSLSGWIVVLLSCSAIAARCAPRVEIAEGEGGEGGDEPSSGASTYGGSPSAGRAGGGIAGGGAAGDGTAGNPIPSFGGNGASAGSEPGSAGDTSSGGTGEPGVCTPGADQTCNDNPIVSALWGHCEADGTCSCNAGFAVNATTGRCVPGTANPQSACGLPKDPGECLDVGVLHYYFDVATGTCEEFRISCGGQPRNANAFKTRAECEGACVSPACEVPFVDGVCDALIPVFSYNARTGICEPRSYGGCGGTPNRFRSEEDCQAACKASGGPTAVIQGPSCHGFGETITAPGDEASFELDGTVLKGRVALGWGAGCPQRPEFVMMYEPASPIQLRLCHDEGADPCEGLGNPNLSWDLSEAIEAAGTNEFVFAE